ncbi:MAG: hypothetical protein ACM3X9_00045 [Bacillota bacterium]
MKKPIQIAGWTLFFLLSAAIVRGDYVIRAIKIEYLPGAEDILWAKNIPGQNLSNYQPVVALNYFNDERGAGYNVGAVYSRSGKQVEALVADEKPADILEKALSRQLEKCGFQTIATMGWNFSQEAIPSYLQADFIIGGRISAFWVESRAGLLNSTIDSRVGYDLIIADARNKKIVWAGPVSSRETKKSLVHTNDYFWADIQSSINKSFTLAVNRAFQDNQARKAIINIIQRNLSGSR